MIGVDDPRLFRRTPTLWPRYLLADGRGNTIGVADNDDNFSYQRFDAFGLPLTQRPAQPHSNAKRLPRLRGVPVEKGAGRAAGAGIRRGE